MLQKHEVMHDLFELQDALKKTRDTLSQNSELVAQQALIQLANANEALARILHTVGNENQVVRPLSEQANPACVNTIPPAMTHILTQPLSVLKLDTRASRVCQCAPLLVMQGEYPYYFQRGLSCVGELTQLREQDLLQLRNCGESTLSSVAERLAQVNLALGTDYNDEYLHSLGINRIVLDKQVWNPGSVAAFQNGECLERFGGANYLVQQVSTVMPLVSSDRDLLNHIRIRGPQDKRGRQVATIGELVQVNLPLLHRMACPQDLLNFLLPKGLCLAMIIPDSIMQQHGIPRVSLSQILYR